MSRLPKDVDEFIEARYCMFSTTAEKFISETDLRTFLAQYVLCAPEVVAHATSGGGVYINRRGDHVFGDTPLHAPAKGLPETSATQEQTP